MKRANADTDLTSLQYLLCILVMYEKQINTLLSQHRRTDSNSDSAKLEPRSSCTTIHTANQSTPQESPTKELPLDEVRTMIFQQEGSTLDGLVYLSGADKDHAVDFTKPPRRP